MKLTINDRILLISILPIEGKYETLLGVQDIKKKIQLTQHEITKHNVKTIIDETTKQSHIAWSVSDKSAIIDFTELEKKIISDTLKKLDEAEKLTESLLPLYKLFV